MSKGAVRVRYGVEASDIKPRIQSLIAATQSMRPSPNTSSTMPIEAELNQSNPRK